MQTNSQLQPERETETAEAGSVQRDGSAATCDWKTRLDSEETCGRPATHLRLGGANLTYCTEHAIKLSPYCDLRLMKPQNIRISDNAGT